MFSLGDSDIVFCLDSKMCVCVCAGTLAPQLKVTRLQVLALAPQLKVTRLKVLALATQLKVTRLKVLALQLSLR